MALWQSSIDHIKANPLTGIGYGLEVEDVMSSRAASFDTRLFLQHKSTGFNSHNYYLQITLSTGLPGLAIFVWFLYSLYKHLYTSWRAAPNGRYRVLQSATFAVSIGAAFGFLFDTGTIMSSGSYANYFWIALGLSEAVRRKNLLE